MKKIDTFFKKIYFRNIKQKLFDSPNVRNFKKASNSFDDDFELK